MEKGIRDLILFFVFSGVPIASFLLQKETYPDAQFMGLLLVVFLVLLIWIRQYYGEESFKSLVDYDENLDFEGLLFVAGGMVTAYLVSGFIVSNLAISAIYVPFRNMDWSYGGFQLSGIWNDFLFNITLVAPAEELCKLALHLAIYMRLKGSLDDTLAKALAIILPIGTWSMLHAYSAYKGPNMFTLILAAFLGGIVIFAVMWKTKSLLAAIFVHAGYNCIVVYMKNRIPIPSEQLGLDPLITAAICAVTVLVVAYSVVWSRNHAEKTKTIRR